MKSLIIKRLKESIELKQKVINDSVLIEILTDAANDIVKCLKNGGKLVICGNGGSASDALHFAGEVVGRFQMERNPWPAVVLNADVTTLTAIANDYGYEECFARQAKAHLTSKDIFIGISTSGNSLNVMKAVTAANNIGAITIGFLGKNGGQLKDMVDYPLVIPSNITARIQECHICIIHILCELVESNMADL